MVMMTMIMKISIGCATLYTFPAFTLRESIESDIQENFAQKCPTFLLKFPILLI